MRGKRHVEKENMIFIVVDLGLVFWAYVLIEVLKQSKTLTFLFVWVFIFYIFYVRVTVEGEVGYDLVMVGITSG